MAKRQQRLAGVWAEEKVAGFEAVESGVFDSGELVRMLVYDTPRWIFPGRNLGTLSDGAETNFVLLEANPLEDLGHLTERAGVMVRGRWLDREFLEAGLRAIAAKYPSVS